MRDSNVEQHKWGDPNARLAGRNSVQDHADLGAGLKNAIGQPLMDFEAAAAMSGARFVALRGQMARLERALATFMLDTQTLENGYEEVSPPLLVRANALIGTSQLPKFSDDLFGTNVTEEAFNALATSHVEQVTDSLKSKHGEIAPGMSEVEYTDVLEANKTEILNRIHAGSVSESARQLYAHFLIPTSEV